MRTACRSANSAKYSNAGVEAVYEENRFRKKRMINSAAFNLSKGMLMNEAKSITV